MLAHEHKLRFARHLLLADIGEAGQARLSAANVHVAGGADPRAAAIALRYLLRAGLQQGSDQTGIALALPAGGAVRALAGSAELDGAAAALAGAFAAVEAIKQVLGIGTPGSLETLSLDAEGPP